MKPRKTVPILCALVSLALVTLAIVSCNSSRESETAANSEPASEDPIGAAVKPVVERGRTPQITDAFIQDGLHGRHVIRPMTPKYITIHSTQNTAEGANAETHARALANGALKSQHNSLGFLTWHFTVDDHSIYQSLPTNEQGQHADYDGPGNQFSIGIEMCENIGNSREITIERTANLTAWLLRQYDIPLSNVVPHQHWRRIRPTDNKDLGHKNCPHFLLDNGVPGEKWKGFLGRVAFYRKAFR